MAGRWVGTIILWSGVAAGGWCADAVAFRVVGGEMLEGGTVPIEVLVDNTLTDVCGWSYGVCLDPGLFSVVEMHSLDGTLQVKAGDPADYDLSGLCAGGVSRGVIIDNLVTMVLPVANGFRDFGITLRARDLAEGEPAQVTAVVRPCHEEICEPPMRAVWTDASGSSTPAGLVAGSVTVHRKVVAVKYLAEQGVRVPVDPATGAAIGDPSAAIRIEEQPAPFGGGPPTPIQAFFMGLSFDPTKISIVRVEQGVSLASFRGGDGPDFFEAAIGAECLYVACTISMAAPFETLVASPAATVLAIALGVPSGVYVGATESVTVTLPFIDVCGTPQVVNHIVVDGRDVPIVDLAANPLSVVVDPVARVPFVRGDANVDGRVDVGDVVSLIDELFRHKPPRSCEFSKDANGDRRADLSDVVFLIDYIFRHVQTPPPAPYPACGVASGQDTADCLSYPPCAL